MCLFPNSNALEKTSSVDVTNVLCYGVMNESSIFSRKLCIALGFGVGKGFFLVDVVMNVNLLLQIYFLMKNVFIEIHVHSANRAKSSRPRADGSRFETWHSIFI